MTDTTTAAPPPVQPTPANAKEAGAQLSYMVNDKAFGARLLAGDHMALREWNAAHAVQDSGNPIDNLLDENAPKPLFAASPNGPAPAEIGTVDNFRDLGISEPAIRQFFEGKQVPKSEWRLVEVWKSQRMSDKEWTRRYMAGDKSAAREMMLANLVLAGGYEGDGGILDGHLDGRL